MRKTITFILMLMMFPVFIASAVSHPENKGKRQVDLLSFVELTTVRLLEAEKSSGTKLGSFSDYYYNDIRTDLDGKVDVSCNAGRLSINPEDFSIREYSNVFMYLSDDDERNNRSIYQAIIAMSALEYGVIDESLIKIDEKRSAYEKMKSIFFGQIADQFESSLFWIELKDGKDKVIYSGNFTYTLHYFKTDHPNSGELQEIIMISAKQ